MKNKKELRNWLDEFNLNHPLTIAGPCSAETEEQVLKIAHSLKDSKATVLEQDFGNLELDLEILKESGL